MLDIRYFNSNDNTTHVEGNQLLGYRSPIDDHSDKIPQITLNDSVGDLLANYNIGGVILFSENLVNQDQIQTLTKDLQDCVDSSISGQKLLISIDQEGGRVARLPRDTFPAFTGNMAIGALNDSNQDISYKVGEAIGSQLSCLGINVNHAPTVDVNSNPNNPVINVRSFSDCPNRVASLGCAMGQGMLASGIIPTYKHFPGHGDTNVDSHTGLPQVNHDLDTVYNVDLFPFVKAIEEDCIPMVMTAHIQYPVLDNSLMTGRDGKTFVRPATLSHAILTNLLRKRLKYKGVVITDALDMASISNYLTPAQAVVETFKAGADIALMPFKIHKPNDIKAFETFFNEIVVHISQNSVLSEKVIESYNRISLLKSKYLHGDQSEILKKQTENLAKQSSLEKYIAENSIVKHSNNKELDLKTITHIITVFQTKEQGIALSNAMSECLNKTLIVNNYKFEDVITPFDSANTLLIIGVEDIKSLVDIGGVDDSENVMVKTKGNIEEHLLSYLTLHKSRGGQSVFICLKAPYNIEEFVGLSTISMTTFDGSVYQNKQQIYQGPAFSAMAKVITQTIIPCGVMPININHDS